MAAFLGTLYTHNTAAKDPKGGEDYHGRPTDVHLPTPNYMYEFTPCTYTGIHRDTLYRLHVTCGAGPIQRLYCPSGVQYRALSGEGMVRGLVVMCNGMLTLMLDHE